MPALSGVNRLLSALPGPTRDAIVAEGSRRPLIRGELLHEQDDAIDEVILPDTGVISLLTLMADGMSVEAALVGPEGVVGFPCGPEGLSPWRAVVQGPGEGLRLPLASFRRHAMDCPELRVMLEGRAGALLATVAQSVACYRFHELPERLARRLLITEDRAGADEFAITHEFLARVLGAHRPSVTIAVQQLERAGLIECRRGRIQVADREGLEAASCECYARIHHRYEGLSFPG